jgi:outer membrane protein OmpA-like peptidoglycan-associated protein
MQRWLGASVTKLALVLPTSIICHPPSAQAQLGNYSSRDKKAIKVYEEALDCMQKRLWSCGEGNLKKAITLDENFVEPRFTLAELFDMQGKDEEAMITYRAALEKAPRFFPNAWLHLAEIEFRNQQYVTAQQHFEQFKQMNDDPVREQRAQLGIESCAYAQEAVKTPVPFDPQNLGPAVNTREAEYYPCITADDAVLMFTRDVHDGTEPYGHQEDFYVSRRDVRGEWMEAQPLRSIDTERNEGAGTLSPDGRFVIFTACAGVDGYGEGRTGMGSCDLFISRRIGDRWSPPENLGAPVNSRNWESQPSLASDGRTLYFIRGMQAADGIKSMDIFVSRLQDDGTFSKPEPLGKNVNTPLQEESVQIHPDGRTLYFSSNGHPGMGGLDIFMSRMQEDGSWGPAQNLGYPINTGGDENSLLVNAKGELAYFASDRRGGEGDLDLYSFTLPERVRPSPVTYIHGVVNDASTGAPVEADVELFDLSTGKLATAAYSDPKTGEFLVCLPSGKDYALNASAENYLFFSQNYSISNTNADKPEELEVNLSAIMAGETIALRNIFFETASFALLPASNAELEKLTKLMQGSPALKIEVGGHTDDVGDDKANQLLSQQRAKAVRDHLIARGIESARIAAVGYGETKPVADNGTEKGRALNRRTEVKVL